MSKKKKAPEITAKPYPPDEYGVVLHLCEGAEFERYDTLEKALDAAANASSGGGAATVVKIIPYRVEVRGVLA